MLIRLARPGVPGRLAEAGGVACPAAPSTALGAADGDTDVIPDAMPDVIAEAMGAVPIADPPRDGPAVYGDEGRAGDRSESTRSFTSFRDDMRGCGVSTDPR